MAEQDNSMSMNQHFLRQRRNVFLSGLVILLLVFFNSSDSTTLKNNFLQGLEIDLDTTLFLSYIAFIYFSVRYVQYFLDEKIWSNLYQVFISTNKHRIRREIAPLDLTLYNTPKSGYFFSFKTNSTTTRSIYPHSPKSKKEKEKDMAGKHNKIYNYIYNTFSWRNLFINDKRAIFNRRYGDYIFPIIFIFITIWVILIKGVFTYL